ncbi:MAG: NUDIX hydrolase [Saprospiraceae bacterium]
MTKKTGTGIVVGRFQTIELTKLHVQLIDYVREKHGRTLVFLASNPAPSDRHPIEWEFRWQMFVEVFGEKVEVFEMPDLQDDRVWSQELDRRILEQKPEGTVTLYGARRDFVERYSGSHQTEVLEPDEADAPDEIVLEGVRSGRDFRAGLLYATLRRFPTVYPTVDIAVFRNDYRELLLARKSGEGKYRFPGGFTDPSDESYEEAVLRELGEECGDLEVRDLIYLGSARVDDWRYRDSMDSVMTHLYACELVDGTPSPDDDIAELRWFDASKIKADQFVHEHRPLVKLLENFLFEEE